MYFRYNAVSFSVTNYFWMMALSTHKKEKKILAYNTFLNKQEINFKTIALLALWHDKRTLLWWHTSNKEFRNVMEQHGTCSFGRVDLTTNSVWRIIFFFFCEYVMSGCIYKAENLQPSLLPHHARWKHCCCTGVQGWKGLIGLAEPHWKGDSQGDQLVPPILTVFCWIVSIFSQTVN